MKKVSFIVLLVLTTLLYSCGMEDCEFTTKDNGLNYTSSTKDSVIAQKAVLLVRSLIGDVTRTYSSQLKAKTVSALSNSTRSEGEDYIYCVEMEDNKGVVLVSTFNNNVIPISYFPNETKESIETSFMGSFDDDLGKLLPQLDTMRHYRRCDTIPFETGDIDWKYLDPSEFSIESMKSPKCQVNWHQFEPYNRYCLKSDNKTTVPAGCAPIAIAQALTVLKLPRTPFITSWDDVTSFNPSPQAIDEIAHLIAEIGHNVGAKYEDGEFSADMSKAHLYLMNFGLRHYDTNADNINNRKRYFETAKILEYLDDEYGIVIASAQEDTNNVTHHAYLIDGYVKYSYYDNARTTPYFFHVNYGYGNDNPNPGYNPNFGMIKEAYLLCEDIWNEECRNRFYKKYGYWPCLVDMRLFYYR